MPKTELSFLEFLQGFRRGELLTEADAQYSELVQAIEDTGGKGEITIRLPFKMNDAGQIEIVPEIKMRKPRKPIGTGIYYVGGEGRLSRTDPKQDDLFDELEERRGRSRD